MNEPEASLPAPAGSTNASTGDVLQAVCDQAMMRNRKRPIRLVERDTWDPEFIAWVELDGDSYSRNGHPPKKLVLKKSTKQLQIRSWNRTPCRYGDTCPGRQNGRCWFMHTSSQDEVEVAAGSALRLRQIQRKLEIRLRDAREKDVNILN